MNQIFELEVSKMKEFSGSKKDVNLLWKYLIDDIKEWDLCENLIGQNMEFIFKKINNKIYIKIELKGKL